MSPLESQRHGNRTSFQNRVDLNIQVDEYKHSIMRTNEREPNYVRYSQAGSNPAAPTLDSHGNFRATKKKNCRRRLVFGQL